MTSQYFLRPSFTVVKIVVNNFDNGLVEHFAEPAMKRCLYGSLCNFGWLVGCVLTSHRQRGHLETAPPFTVPCEGREAR